MVMNFFLHCVMNVDIASALCPPWGSSGESRQLQNEQFFVHPNPFFFQFTTIVKFGLSVVISSSCLGADGLVLLSVVGCLRGLRSAGSSGLGVRRCACLLPGICAHGVPDTKRKSPVTGEVKGDRGRRKIGTVSRSSSMRLAV